MIHSKVQHLCHVDVSFFAFLNFFEQHISQKKFYHKLIAAISYWQPYNVTDIQNSDVSFRMQLKFKTYFDLSSVFQDQRTYNNKF